MQYLEEKWKVVHSHPNYEVSNHGKVLNISRDRLLRMTAGKRGGVRLILYREAEQTVFQLNRLIASMFLPDYDYEREVVFIDGDKKNCRSDNLRMGNRVSVSRDD